MVIWKYLKDLKRNTKSLGSWFPKTSQKLQFHKFFTIQVKDTHLTMMVNHLSSTVSAFLKVTCAEFTTGRLI